MQNAGETERAIAAFASDPNGGLVVTASPFGANHPDLVAALADRYKLPAIYPFRYFVSAGGLISYGADLVKQSRPQPLTSTASSKARSPPTCRCRLRPNTIW
jgi:putative ABC transport system substrate-binding protein